MASIKKIGNDRWKIKHFLETMRQVRSSFTRPHTRALARSKNTKKLREKFGFSGAYGQLMTGLRSRSTAKPQLPYAGGALNVPPHMVTYNAQDIHTLQHVLGRTHGTDFTSRCIPCTSQHPDAVKKVPHCVRTCDSHFLSSNSPHPYQMCGTCGSVAKDSLDK